jgi:mono/diheme cytochrome c family protein
VRRPLKLGLGTAALGLVALASVMALTVRRGWSTHDEPSRLERLVARAMRHLAVPADLARAENPLPDSPEVVAAGRAHWADHCASCHGNDGKGRTELGERLYPRAPDMTLPATQRLSDGELFATIENGIRLSGMPGWGDGTAASAHGSWTLVRFIRHLPRLSSGELVEMEALNPKSPTEWQEMQEEAAFLAGDATAAEGGSPAPSAAGDHHH